MGRLFGTDGVRGVANDELTPQLAFALGRAGASVLLEGLRGQGRYEPTDKGRPLVLIGRDTRPSGSMLEAALAAGVASVGADVIRAGVVPTPGVAYLTRNGAAAAGVMISASHNPAPDNGIKFFAADGFKLDDSTEDRIAAAVARVLDAGATQDDGFSAPTGTAVGRIEEWQGAAATYRSFLKETAGVDLSGLRVVVDCANGAASTVAPAVLAELGADVVGIGAEGDGDRINVDCGSTHPEALQEAVKKHGAHAGLAHDGDADRVVAVDETGAVVDGDHILTICALHLLSADALPKRRIAATVYSNLGLRMALERQGATLTITKPGDRYVLDAMRNEGLLLGGEQSGHIIFLQHTTTGDGILTGLQLLRVMRESGRPLSELARQMTTLPQALNNVRVRDKDEVEGDAAVAELVEQAEADLRSDGQHGRVLLRASGTEPVIRVMVEGESTERVQRWADRVAQEISSRFG